VSSSARHTGLVLAALASGFVMASIDATVVNVAAVSIRASFGSTLSELTWVVDVYVLTFASLLLLLEAWPRRSGAVASTCWG